MHFMPYENGKEQKNILQALFDDRDPETGIERRNTWRVTPETKAQVRIRLWKTLRELDTLPVFIPHLEEEIYVLLQQNSRVAVMKRALEKMLAQGKDMLKDWEEK